MSVGRSFCQLGRAGMGSGWGVKENEKHVENFIFCCGFKKSALVDNGAIFPLRFRSLVPPLGAVRTEKTKPFSDPRAGEHKIPAWPTFVLVRVRRSKRPAGWPPQPTRPPPPAQVSHRQRLHGTRRGEGRQAGRPPSLQTPSTRRRCSGTTSPQVCPQALLPIPEPSLHEWY